MTTFEQGFEPPQLLQQACADCARIAGPGCCDGCGEMPGLVIGGDSFPSRTRRRGDDRAAARPASGFARLFDAVAHTRSHIRSAPIARDRSQSLGCDCLISEPSFKPREAENDMLTRDNPDKRCRADAENSRYAFERFERGVCVVGEEGCRRAALPRRVGGHASRDPRHRCLDGGPGDQRVVTRATDQDKWYVSRNGKFAAGEDGGEAREVEAEHAHGGGFLRTRIEHAF